MDIVVCCHFHVSAIYKIRRSLSNYSLLNIGNGYVTQRGSVFVC